MAKDSDLLDWTITDAPGADEALPQPAPASDARRAYSPHVARRLWVIVGSVIVVLGFGLWGFSAFNAWRIRNELAQMIADEERAAWAGDVRRYVRFSDDGSLNWIKAQTGLAEKNQPAPFPAPGLQLAVRRATLQAFEPLAPDVMRVDVIRTYAAGDGATATFTLPQLYRYRNGAWRRIPPPDIFWGELQNRDGAHVNLRFYTADSAFVREELGPHLDHVLSQACALWGCPADLSVSVNFANYAYLPGDPLMSRRFGENIFLPSPHAQGLPADEAALAHLKHTAALRALYALGELALGGGQDSGQPGNAFFYAFVARTAVRAGVRAPQLETAPSASTLYTYSPVQLWCAYCGAALTEEQERLLRWEAEALLSALLRDQPPAAETALFQALRSATGPVAWAAKGLGLSSSEAQARLDAALAAIQPAPR
jgi:hypothetical protein